MLCMYVNYIHIPITELAKRRRHRPTLSLAYTFEEQKKRVKCFRLFFFLFLTGGRWSNMKCLTSGEIRQQQSQCKWTLLAIDSFGAGNENYVLCSPNPISQYPQYPTHTHTLTHSAFLMNFMHLQFLCNFCKHTFYIQKKTHTKAKKDIFNTNPHIHTHIHIDILLCMGVCDLSYIVFHVDFASFAFVLVALTPPTLCIFVISCFTKVNFRFHSPYDVVCFFSLSLSLQCMYNLKCVCVRVFVLAFCLFEY